MSDNSIQNLGEMADRGVLTPRDRREAEDALMATEKRQYRALAMELAVKTCTGQFPSMSPAELHKMIADTAADYFYYIWDGVR